MSEHVSPEAVVLLVRGVSSRYAEELIRERRTAAPDPARLKALKAGLAACAADQAALQDADEEQVAEITARYAALSRELGGRQPRLLTLTYLS